MAPDDERDPIPLSPKRRPLSKTIFRLVLILAAGYATILGTLIFNETYLVYPGSKFPQGDWNPQNFAFQEVAFESGDGTPLVGWFLDASESSSPASDTEAPPAAGGEANDPVSTALSNQTVLVCHGNAENVAQSSAWTGDRLRHELSADVFVFDYRGFGKSEGSPTEPGVLADAEAALDWLCQKTGKSPDEIIIVGHSIGGGPAVHLAAKCNCKLLVLQRTFSSLPDVAQFHYPWLPVRPLMRNRFPSVDRIKQYHCPLFQSHGDQDTVVPIDVAKKLFAAAPSQQKKFLEIGGMGHFDPLPNAYWIELKTFVLSIDQSERGTWNRGGTSGAIRRGASLPSRGIVAKPSF